MRGFLLLFFEEEGKKYQKVCASRHAQHGRHSDGFTAMEAVGSRRMADQADDNCRTIQERYGVGQILQGIVVDHRAFGYLVYLGSRECLGVVLLPEIEDRAPDPPREPRSLQPGEVRLYPTYPPYTALGSVVTCDLHGFARLGNGSFQPRLSTRASELRHAAE